MVGSRTGAPSPSWSTERSTCRPAVDVQALDCDFYAFSSHKVYGPTGVGVLYGKAALLEALPPYQGGGEMISAVTFERPSTRVFPESSSRTRTSRRRSAPWAAIDYLESVGVERVGAHESDLLAYAYRSGSRIDGFGSSARRATRPGSSRSSSTASIRTTSARPRSRGHRRPRRTTAPSPSCSASASRRRPRLLRDVQHPRRGRRADRRNPQGHRGLH